jgi:hypothetical protein
MKRMKKQQKKQRDEMRKKHFRSLDIKQQVDQNKLAEKHKLEDFQEKVVEKHEK